MVADLNLPKLINQTFNDDIIKESINDEYINAVGVYGNQSKSHNKFTKLSKQQTQLEQVYLLKQSSKRTQDGDCISQNRASSMMPKISRSN